MADPMKDIVVIIPGIGGSVLEREGKTVWAPEAGAALRGILSRGGSIKRLELDGDDPEVDDLGDGVVATRLVDDLHVVPGLDWKIDGYGQTAEALRKRFDLRPGHNYFELAYDWRRDNRVAARRLARLSHDWLRSWRAESGNAEAKLILIAHSMGGIVARLYLELLGGWSQTRTLISMGTPYSGSLNALGFLANGFRKGWGPFTVDLSSTLRSFTSVYQLLPSYRCLEGPGGTWLPLDEVNWAGTGVDDARLRDAIVLQRNLRRAVDDRVAQGHRGYVVRPILSDSQPTGFAARRDGATVTISSMRTLDEHGGDGTVPKLSAVPHELLDGWVNATFVAQRHASLQNDPPVIEHIAGLLRAQTPSTVPVLPAGDAPVVLEVEDALTTEPLTVRARPSIDDQPLTATVIAPDRTVTARVAMIPVAGGWHEALVENLASGDYRISVSGNGSHTVTDIASVIDLAELDQDADSADSSADGRPLR